MNILVGILAFLTHAELIIRRLDSSFLPVINLRLRAHSTSNTRIEIRNRCVRTASWAFISIRSPSKLDRTRTTPEIGKTVFLSRVSTGSSEQKRRSCLSIDHRHCEGHVKKKKEQCPNQDRRKRLTRWWWWAENLVSKQIDSLRLDGETRRGRVPWSEITRQLSLLVY